MTREWRTLSDEWLLNFCLALCSCRRLAVWLRSERIDRGINPRQKSTQRQEWIVVEFEGCKTWTWEMKWWESTLSCFYYMNWLQLRGEIRQRSCATWQSVSRTMPMFMPRTNELNMCIPLGSGYTCKETVICFFVGL